MSAPLVFPAGGFQRVPLFGREVGFALAENLLENPVYFFAELQFRLFHRFMDP